MNMSFHRNDHHHFSDPEIYEDESESLQTWEDEYGDNLSKSEKHAMVRKKIEEKLEQKRLRHDLDDFDEELFQDFDWGE